MRSLNTVVLHTPQTDEEKEAVENQMRSAAIRTCQDAQNVEEARTFLQILGLIESPPTMGAM